jgi:uncharacterized protein YdaT
MADPSWRAGETCEPATERVTMPWNSTYFPVSMKHLLPLVREKAIEIANALLDEGMEEGKAIRIAIARAKAWAERRSKDD